MSAICRGCGWVSGEDHARAGAPERGRCPSCGSPRTVRHPELRSLSIVHIDCDAFYATVEKRDDPTLSDRPVIVGGRHRGVVTAACYIARRFGVRSAMPMFQALRLCPAAVVIRPNMAKYQFVGRQVREILLETTRLVQPVSIDEAFLDLGGTGDPRGTPPAATAAAIVRRIEREVGITASIGLSCNKFLAKIASELDKPRGFAVIGAAEAAEFLAPKPVGLIAGVGPAMGRRLNRDGIRTIGQLQQIDPAALVGRYGRLGRRLADFAYGRDSRPVEPESETKSVSSETTFERDLSDLRDLREQLRPLCERVASRLAARGLAGRTVVLKLKTADFRILTRSRRLEAATRRAETLLRAAGLMLEREAVGARYRLIGIGVSDIGDALEADPPDLFDALDPPGVLSDAPSTRGG